MARVKNSFNEILDKLTQDGNAQLVSHEQTVRIDRKIADAFQRAAIRAEIMHRRAFEQTRNTRYK